MLRNSIKSLVVSELSEILQNPMKQMQHFETSAEARNFGMEIQFLCGNAFTMRYNISTLYYGRREKHINE